MPSQNTPVEAFVGFGSNLGDCLGNIRAAQDAIAALEGVELVASSSIYRTEPVGVPEKYKEIWFYNTVALYRTSLPVNEWSRALHAIEAQMHRTRAERNAPRTIDIDLLTYGTLILQRPDLTLPHPQCLSRRFVCQPLAELRPDFIIPGQTKTVAQILTELPLTPQVEKLTFTNHETREN